MKRKSLCLSLMLACSFSCLAEDRPLHDYAITWTCLSESCQRAEQIALLDRVSITDASDLCEFWSTRDSGFFTFADLVASSSLPSECYWLVDLSLFGHPLGQLQFCRIGDGFAVELAIPDRDPPTQSKWRVDGRYLGKRKIGSISGAP